MAKPVWQQKLQARMDRNPLFWEEPTKEEKEANPHAPSHIRCQECGGKSKSEGGTGKRVTLREAVNYSFHTCEYCKRTVR